MLFWPQDDDLVQVVNYTVAQESRDEFILNDFRAACASTDWGPQDTWNRFPVRIWDTQEFDLQHPPSKMALWRCLVSWSRHLQTRATSCSQSSVHMESMPRTLLRNSARPQQRQLRSVQVQWLLQGHQHTRTFARTSLQGINGTTTATARFSSSSSSILIIERTMASGPQLHAIAARLYAFIIHCALAGKVRQQRCN